MDGILNADAGIMTDPVLESGRKAKGAKVTKPEIIITAPKMMTASFALIGTSPLCINRFSAKALEQMIEKQKAGSTANSKKVREAKDFEAAFQEARHVSPEGWDGIHAGAFRNAMIDACRLVGFAMTKAKMSVFVQADGYDRIDGTPLVRIHAGEPEISTTPVRNASGVMDIRTRPMWREWRIVLRVIFDADQFTVSDVSNLVARVGAQVGIGEGRAFSKESAGMGWGHFRVEPVVDLDTGRPA